MYVAMHNEEGSLNLGLRSKVSKAPIYCLTDTEASRAHYIPRKFLYINQISVLVIGNRRHKYGR